MATRIQGRLAAYLLAVFTTFEGLTPVELVLRIGQHNNVTEGMLLAGLEYISGSGASDDFEILAPRQSGVYAPGDLRIRARGKSGAIITSISGTVGGQDVRLKPDGEHWQSYASVPAEGVVTLSLTATFQDSAPATQTLTFTVSSDPAIPEPDPFGPEPDPGDPEPDPQDPEPPGGDDEEELERLKKDLDKKMRDLVLNLPMSGEVDEPLVDNILQDLHRTISNGSRYRGQGGQSGGGGASGSWGEALEHLEEAQTASEPNAIRSAAAAAVNAAKNAIERLLRW